ncbi:MAG: hypothetical protein V7K21_04150 [Nostoc sp.]|uniref:hypothetical protein n=1 Tax=Nostoc sp. TaxID=1180 RepID=UPI002FFAD3D0
MVRHELVLGLLDIAVSRDVIVSDQEKPLEEDKPSEKKMIVQGLLFIFVLVPAIFIVFGFLLNEFVAKTPLVRSFDDAARRAKIDACESHRAFAENKSPDDDCYKEQGNDQ